jgi:hypothetical protein
MVSSGFRKSLLVLVKVFSLQPWVFVPRLVRKLIQCSLIIAYVALSSWWHHCLPLPFALEIRTLLSLFFEELLPSLFGLISEAPSLDFMSATSLSL